MKLQQENLFEVLSISEVLFACYNFLLCKMKTCFLLQEMQVIHTSSDPWFFFHNASNKSMALQAFGHFKISCGQHITAATCL